MKDIKSSSILSIIVDDDKDTIGFSFSEYARFIGKSESGIRHRANEKQYKDYIYYSSLKGQRFRVIPADLCLEWLLKDNPQKINLFVEEIKSLTGKVLDFPDFSNFGAPKMKKAQPKKDVKSPNSEGFIYLFESELKVLKLGFSTNVERRFRELQRWRGELVILEVVKGAIKEEGNIHKLLHSSGEYLGDEWYPIHRKDEILRLMKTL
jgi:hypothetical protein